MRSTGRIEACDRFWSSAAPSPRRWHPWKTIKAQQPEFCGFRHCWKVKIEYFGRIWFFFSPLGTADELKKKKQSDDEKSLTAGYDPIQVLWARDAFSHSSREVRALFAWTCCGISTTCIWRSTYFVGKGHCSILLPERYTVTFQISPSDIAKDTEG